MNAWKEVQLSSVVDINARSYSSKDNFSDVYYLDTGNITQNAVDEIVNIDLSQEKLPSRARRKIKLNSVVYSTVRPNQRHYGIIRKEMPQNFLVSTGFAVIDAKQEYISPEYLYYFLTQNEIVEILQSIAEQSVSTYPSITAKDIGNLRLLLPPVETQKRIASILRSLDDKIELNNRINENLEQQASALVSDYCDSVSNTVELGEIMTFKNGFAFQSKSYLPSGKYGIITIKNVQDGRIDSQNIAFIDKVPPGMKSSCYLHIGDVLLSLTGYVGRVGIVCEDGLLLNQRVAKIAAYNDDLLPWLYYYFRLPSTKASLETISRGTAQANLSPVETLKLPIPFEISSAKRLSNKLKPFFDQEISKSIESLRLAEIRDSLLPKLISGELDVSAIDL